jgi:tetratricopeptide (TPR) repeat protein
MISSLLFLTLQAAAAKPMEAVVLQQATTGAAIRLDLPEFMSDDTVLGSLRRRQGDRAIAQGKLRGDGTLMVVSAYGEMRPSAEWRKELMVGKILGLGQFNVGTTACTEGIRELEPPYSNMSWHAFPTLADTCFDISMGSLAKDGVSPITRADFEHIVTSVRYGIVRLGKWDDMPKEVMEHMHAGLSRAENDGAVFLAEKSKAAPEDWALALAAAEIGMRTKMPAPDRHALYERALAGLGKTDRLNAGEMFATMTAQCGLAFALRDEGKLDEALATLAKTQSFELAKTKMATAALEYEAATIYALKLDAAAAVEHLKLSIAADPDRRDFTKRDPAFAGIGANQDLLKLLKPPK